MYLREIMRIRVGTFWYFLQIASCCSRRRSRDRGNVPNQVAAGATAGFNGAAIT